MTIAGQSAGGLSVLAHMVSPGARGLFQRAIVQSGTFALTQRPLAAAEAAGETFAQNVGCPDQTAACLRSVPVSDLVSKFGVEIPGVVDGSVLTQSIGTALARGQFARVPVINGITHDEELLFVAGLGITVSQGTNIPLAGDPTDPANYQANIAQALGVSPARAAAIANEYPLSAYPNPVAAFSLLVSDASFACPALQVDRWTAARGVPTYAYQFNDDNAPVNLVGSSLGLATHGTELPYLFDQPNAPFPAHLDQPGQQELAASMRTAWASFAASGNPATRALPWPAVGNGTKVLSFVPCSRRSRPASPPRTTARSGPPDNRADQAMTFIDRPGAGLPRAPVTVDLDDIQATVLRHRPVELYPRAHPAGCDSTR